MENSKKVTYSKTGSGHWKITTTHYGKEISTTTTNSLAIDCLYDEDFKGRYTSKQAEKSLRNQIITANKNN